jgi:hypothetical protein
MSPVKNVTLSGFNETVQTIVEAQKEFPDQEHFVSLVTFCSTRVKTLLDIQPAEELFELTQQSYNPNGSTPLYDAIGKSLTRLEIQTEKEENYSVLVTILTDGMENSSKEFSEENVNKLISRLKEKGWGITYMGANHDVKKTAKALAIDSFTEFRSDKKGMEDLFEKERAGRRHVYREIYYNKFSPASLVDFWDQEK